MPQATRDQRLKLITAKYVDRTYVTPIASAISHYTSPDDALVASVKKNAVQGVLYALALKANPNAADRSRNTHSVFLALAAADPAAPADISTPGTSPNSRAAPKTPKGIAFPIAELLVQNGAVIPATLPAFPLSSSAQLYIDQKSAHDTVGELPTIRNVSIAAGQHDSPDVAKLQKRSLVEEQPDPGDDAADFAQAFKELAKGEQAASAMENQLTALERKIDALLESAEAQGAMDEGTKDRESESEKGERRVGHKSCA
ncbi:MAG: hypothetical protein Q9207_007228 [Kuettlingeria erythrocarpa]